MQALAVLAIGFATSAPAATSPMPACDRAPSLPGLEVPIAALTAIAVGHPADESEVRHGHAPEALPAPTPAPAPILNLAPRLALILEGIFSAVAIETPPMQTQSQASVSAIETVAADGLTSSPLAGDAGRPESPQPTGPDSDDKAERSVPSFQRRMLRTDI